MTDTTKLTKSFIPEFASDEEEAEW
jgi:hypothetical protein